MFVVETDVSQGILRMTFTEHVTADDLKRCRTELEQAVAKLARGFRVFTDLSELDQMDFDCIPEIRGVMDLLRERGVGRVIRVIPDPGKDIGFGILSFFHYGPNVHVQTFETLPEAIEHLSDEG
jgi:hypothetical protein